MLQSGVARRTMSQIDIIKNTRFIVYDLETTGLGKKDQIVQLAAQNLYDASDYMNVYVQPTVNFHWAASRANGLTKDKQTGKLCKNKLPIRNVITNIQLGDENIASVVLIGYNNDNFDNKVLCRSMPNLLYHGLESYTENIERKLFSFDVIKHTPKRCKLGVEFARLFGQNSANLIEWHDAKGDVEATAKIAKKLFNATEIYEKSVNFYREYSKIM